MLSNHVLRVRWVFEQAPLSHSVSIYCVFILEKRAILTYDKYAPVRGIFIFPLEKGVFFPLKMKNWQKIEKIFDFFEKFFLVVEQGAK